MAVDSTSTMSGCYQLADDRRELILARLATVLGGLGVTFGRNDPDIPETVLPKITLLDSDEDSRKDTFDRGRPAYGPNLIALAPEIYITVVEDTPDEVGATLNEWEQTIVGAITTDATLRGLAHAIEFHGMETGTQPGRSNIGQASFEFTIWYKLETTAPCVPTSVVLPNGVEGREAILEAIKQIAEQTEGIDRVLRNELSLPDDEGVSVVMLDGSETADSRAYGRGRPPDAPNRVVMEPEIYIIAQADPTLAGPTLSRARLMLLRGILNDPVLADLAMDGDIRYEGCQTAMGAGRGMTGEMGMVVSIARVIRPGT